MPHKSKSKTKSKPSAKSPRQIKIPQQLIKLCSNRHFNYGDRVIAKLSPYVTIKGKILAQAKFPDIYEWYVIRVRKLPLREAIIVVSHDKIKLRK